MQIADGELIIFAKAPVPGRVNRRLIPALGESGATELHRRLLRFTLEKFCYEPVVEVSLWSDDPAHPYIQRCGHEFSIRLEQQQGEELGERMRHALAHVLQGKKMAVLIGTDCPALDSAVVLQAFNRLSQGCDAVLGPAEDGGYVLVGLSRACDEIFKQMPWGSAEVLALTEQRLKQADHRYALLPSLADIDDEADLINLPDAVRLPVL